MNNKESRQRMRNIIDTYGPATLAYSGIDAYRKDYGRRVIARDFVVECMDSNWEGIAPFIMEGGQTIIGIQDGSHTNYLCTCGEFNNRGSCGHGTVFHQIYREESNELILEMKKHRKQLTRM